MSQGELHTSDGFILAERSWSPSSPPRGAVVLAHGFSASKDEPAVVAVAEALRDAGLHVVSYDARGHGQSEGDCTLGDLERLDVAAAVASARLHSPRIVLVGASMGAIAVLRYAVTDADLAGVVSVSSPAAWRVPRTARSLLAAGLTRTAPGRWVAARRLKLRISPRWSNPEPPGRLAARLACPLAIVHGDSDRFISAREADALYSSAVGPRCLHVVPGMGHAFEPAAIPAIVESVDWILAMSTRRAPGGAVTPA